MAIKIAPDKKKHFFVGIPLGIFLQVFAQWLYPFQSVNAWLVSFVLLVIICYGFELFSLITGKGHYEIMDAVAGILGGVLGMAFWWGVGMF
jgi:glycopeptide antibiotics resistance protein